MIKTWVLIMVIQSGSFENTNIETVQTEFNTLETCQMAAKSQIQQLHKSFYNRVQSWGCYLK